MRKTKNFDDRLFAVALQHWLDWLLAFHAPRQQGHRAADGVESDLVWEAALRQARSNTEHTDPVLARFLRDERAEWDWPASIHAMVCDLPGTWQVVLLGTALGYSQATIGEGVGVRQQNVSSMLALIKSRFMPRLLLLGATERMCHKLLGRDLPPAGRELRLRVA